ncbi:hypothetical protein TURU_065261 [Turdus rufiventris]|nr:hypothetical protein TURU_065261 [Turdus rufiventris]
MHIRFAVETLKSLLCQMWYNNVVKAMERKRGWDVLLCPDTQHHAAALLASSPFSSPPLDASWAPAYAQEAMDFIQVFVSSPDQLQDKDLKHKFLDSICTLCRAARDSGFSQGLDVFCRRYKLGEMIEVLLKLESKHEICTQVRRLAMLAIAGLSMLGTLLEKNKKFLRICFDRIFFLPPNEEMQSLEASLYAQTLHAMDTMLEVMVLSSPASKTSEMLQDILEVLLDYLFFDRVAVQERVMGRVRLLSHLLAGFSPVQDGQNENSAAASRQIQIPVLGKLLGHLFFKLFKKEETSLMALDILCSFLTFVSVQKYATMSPVMLSLRLGATLPEGHAQIPAYWESEITSLLNMSSSRRVQVPKIVRHIFTYCDEKNTTAHSFHSLLVLMANKWPGQVITVALEVAPIFSDKVCLWKAMFSVRQTLEKVLKELQIQLQDWHNSILSQQQNTCLAFLAMLASDHVQQEELSPLYEVSSFLRYPGMEMVPLVLRALVTLSQTAETKEECVRQLSICLFRDLLDKTVWRDKKVMKRNAWKALVRLILCMSDQVPGAAKASKEAVMAIAELLKWQELKHLAQTEQTWRMAECLLAKDRSRAEQFVWDCQLYLLSPQAPIREAALRFIASFSPVTNPPCFQKFHKDMTIGLAVISLFLLAAATYLFLRKAGNCPGDTGPGPGSLQERSFLLLQATGHNSQGMARMPQSRFSSGAEIQEACKFTLGQKITALVSHTVSAVLEIKGRHWLSPQRFLKYQAIMVEQDDVEIIVTNIINPASFLSANQGDPVHHDCLETIEASYSSCTDLKDTPLDDAEIWFTDGSTCVISGKRHARCAVTTRKESPKLRFQWKMLPQGMINSPTICQITVDRALAPVRQSNPTVTIMQYMDDILTTTPSTNQIKIHRDIKTLHNVQQRVGSLQWLRNIVLIPPEVMDPLNDLLKGKNPWDQETMAPEVRSSLNFIEHQMPVSTLTRWDSSTPVDLIYLPFHKQLSTQPTKISEYLAMALAGFGGEIRYTAKLPWTQLLTVIDIDLPPKITDRPQAGPTVFTDASLLTSTAAAVWQSGEQWQCVKTTDPTLSVQQLEAAAVVLAYGLFPEEHLNIVTDSIFVAKLCLDMSGPGVSVSTLATMLEEVLHSRKGTISIIHINSHDPIKGFYQIGNNKADAAAKGVWTLKEARQLHESLHIEAKALAKKCGIPTADVKHIIATCPHCQKSPLWSSSVNPRGLKASEIWQTDFTQYQLLRPRAWLAVTMDTYSSMIMATQHPKTDSKATIQHWLTAMAWLGVPKQIKTDNSTNFISKTVQAFISKWNIALGQYQRVRWSPDHTIPLPFGIILNGEKHIGIGYLCPLPFPTKK